MSRADTFTIVSKTPEYYSDFLSNFDTNPVTGLLARVTNEEAVKQSIKFLILTRLTERFYDPHKGSKVNAVLFDPIDAITENQLRTSITTCIDQFEPRANLLNVVVNGHPERNAYFVEIWFTIINIPNKTFNVNVVLKRVR